MKEYRILLDDSVIGTTDLEKADPPMGVVMGRIRATESAFGYSFLKDHCLRNGIIINYDDLELKLIHTQNIPGLKVMDDQGLEVSGIGSSIAGMDEDGYDVTIIGVPYPFYEEEFPHHVRAYYG